MRVFGAIVIALVAVGGLVGTYLLGVLVGWRRNFDARLRELRLDRSAVELYPAAVKVLFRLRETRSDVTGDILTDETRQMVDDWFTKRKKAISL